MDTNNQYDVIIIGGSYAGLSAAMSLGRSLRKVLFIDSFQQTTVPGVFACGDNCSSMRSVANAVAAGNLSGAVINKMLTQVKGF